MQEAKESMKNLTAFSKQDAKARIVWKFTLLSTRKLPSAAYSVAMSLNKTCRNIILESWPEPLQ